MAIAIWPSENSRPRARKSRQCHCCYWRLAALPFFCWWPVCLLLRGAKGQPGNMSLEMQWSTPIFVYFVDAKKATKLNRNLLSAATKLRKADPVGRKKSARGAWQSAADLHMQQSVAPKLFGEFQKEVHAATEGFWRMGLERTPHATGQAAAPSLYVKDMWMNLLGPGSSHKVHKHAGTMLSGVYYVNAPASLLGGEYGALKFRDPRPQTSVFEGFEWMGFGSDTQINPAEGMMLMWPSWIDHYVEPLREDLPQTNVAEEDPKSLRVTIAFNIGLQS